MATMKLVIKGKNLDVTPALRTYAEKKVSKFEKLVSGDQELLGDITLRTERENHIAEITIDLKGVVIRAESRTGDMYASIDDAVDKLERQWNKFKTKIQKRTQGPKISKMVPPSTSSLENHSSSPEFKIVRTKRFAFKPMDEEEAIMQMELLGHDFFVFTNAVDDQVSVVYKRKDGNYGLIESDF